MSTAVKKGDDEHYSRKKKMMGKMLLLLSLVVSSVIGAADDAQVGVYDFNKSTSIIVSLLRSGNLGSILEEHNPEQLDILIKNFSPALMAFEAEVLSCTMPVLLYFYRTTDSNKVVVDVFMEKLAEHYQNHTKIVAIDVDIFFSIAQATNVQETPSFALCRNRVIETLVTGSQSIARITALMQ